MFSITKQKAGYDLARRPRLSDQDLVNRLSHLAGELSESDPLAD